MKRLIVVLLVTMLASISLLAADSLTICSFNLKWLGYYPERNVEAIAQFLASYDIVLIQEIVAPPYDGKFPNGEQYRPDVEVAAFFDEMTQVRAFRYVLSEEDTGSTPKNHYNSSWTEWFAVFYKPDRIEVTPDLPNGFLATDVTKHPVFNRVPYAFGLREIDTGFDFVVVSVHLHAGHSDSDAQARLSELASIADWISKNNSKERHFIVTGDMNFDDCTEIREIAPPGFQYPLSDSERICFDSSASLAEEHPYDFVFYTADVPFDRTFGLRVIDLVTGLGAIWNPYGEAIEQAYKERHFVQQFSDHNPIIFRIEVPIEDSD
jgi:hypothetical protein